MTTVTFNGNGASGAPYLNGYDPILSFSSFVSNDGQTYIFQSTGSRTITVTGADIVTNGAGRFTSGAITEVTISAAVDPATTDFVFSDLLLDGTTVFGINGGSVPTAADVWLQLLAGPITFNGVNDPGVLLGMDGNFLNGGSFSGEDSVVRGGFGGTSYISGNFNQVIGAAIVHGGEMDFEGYAAFVIGDVYYSQDTVRVIGGNDHIVITDFSNAVIPGASVNFSGDVHEAAGDASTFGGDDFIDVRDVSSFTGTIRISGDIQFAIGNFVVGGDDTIRGSLTLDNIIAGDQMSNTNIDSFIGGDDTIWGGGGNDLIYGDIGSETVTGSAGGNDSIYGGGGNDSLYGGGGNDRIFVGQGNSFVYGGNGNDLIRLNKEGDTSIVGGNGTDTIDYSKSEDGVTISLLFQDSYGGGLANGDSFSSIENVRGSETGNDTIYGGEDDNKIETYGGNDRIYDRAGNDVIKAGSGNDILYGGRDADRYYGGSGTDTLIYDGGSSIRADLKDNSGGNGDAAGDMISGFENLTGGGSDDTLFGDDGRNFLRGGSSDDRLVGRKGDDNIYGQNDDDKLEGGADDDKLFGGSGNDRLFGGSEDDLLSGGSDNDTVFGGSGVDNVKGGGGNDRLYGGKDNDMITGGTGVDTFVFSKGDDRDTITDFKNNTDRLTFEGFINPGDAFTNATQVGGDVVIDMGGGDVLTVKNITVLQLQDDIFIVL